MIYYNFDQKEATPETLREIHTVCRISKERCEMRIWSEDDVKIIQSPPYF